MTRLLIHIGYHKTATTWMQHRLFQPDHGFHQLATHQEVFDHVVKPHGLTFDPTPMRNLIAERLSPLPPKYIPVVSSEILSGHPFFGGRESDDYAYRLRSIAPEAQILISIRSQMKILPSVYMQYLLRGGTLPYDHFFAGTDVPGFFGFRPEHFEYHRLVSLYQKLFGAENVYVLTQESLQADMEIACSEIAAFCNNSKFVGLSEAGKKVRGASYPEYAAPVLRRVNHLRRSPMNPYPALPFASSDDLLYRTTGYVLRQPPFSVLFDKKKPVADYVKQVFSGYFTSSNNLLGRIVVHPVDLSRYE